MFSQDGFGLIAHAQIQGDPTHTLTLRRAYSAQMTKRFRALKGVIRKSLIDNDALALRPMSNAPPAGKSTEQIKGQFSPIPARRFDFRRSSEKIQGFMDWLDEQERQGILEITRQEQIGRALEDHWQNIFIRSAYQKGILRARQEMQSAGYAVPDVDDVGGLNAVFNQPFHVDRVGTVYTRAFEELKGITAAMDQQISRELAEGLARGDGPEAMARRINDRVDKVGLSRARTLARTETIRAHHVATIQEYRNAGIEGVKVKAEWSTAGDELVCRICRDLEGQVYDLDTIEGMIPRHPNCRCCALPIDKTEVEEEAGVGGKAIEGVTEPADRLEFPSDVISRIRREERPLNLIIKPEWDKAFREAGLTDDQLNKLKRIIHNHGLGEEAQEKADALIFESIQKADDKLGEALRATSRMEEIAYDTWRAGAAARREAAKEALRKEWEFDPDFMKSESGFDSFEEHWDMIEYKYTDEPLKVYRKGSVGNNVESWTTSPAGADIGGGRTLTPDHISTVKEMQEQGYSILGGFCRMMGSPGEAEVTFVKWRP